MYHRISGKTKKVFAVGVATTIALSTLVIPAAASEDYSMLSISARVEEYISDSPAEDPVAELIGIEDISTEKKSENVLSASKGKAAAKAAVDVNNGSGTADVVEDEENTGAEEEVTASPDDNEAGAENTTEAAEASSEQKQVETVKYPQFKDRCIVTVNSGVLNIRAEASTDAEIVGQIERGGIALVEENGNGWTKIGSGSCEGYASNDYLAFGDDAGAWAENNNITKIVTVKASGLRVREEANTNGTVIASLFENETYKVVQDGAEWVKIKLNDDKTGYVSADYVEVRFDTPKAKTMAQIEEARKAEEAAARREQERKEAEAKAAKEAKEAEAAKAAKAAEESKKKENSVSSGSSSKSSSSSSSTSSSKSSSSSSSSGETKKTTTTETTSETKVSSGSSSQLRAEMVEYAKQFLGNPYVYGGTSLTKGTDCSGFTMRIYEHFGFTIPRAGGQRTFGKKISVNEAQPGDLIFYPGHVTMYIGNGQVIHASSAKVGIIISSLTYSGTPEFATNIIDFYNK